MHDILQAVWDAVAKLVVPAESDAEVKEGDKKKEDEDNDEESGD